MQNIKAFILGGSNHEPLGLTPSTQDLFNKASINYVQKKENPQYNQIILHTSDQNDSPPRKFVFHCSIGCYLGLEICVVDANNECIDFSTCRWTCNGPFLTQMIQDEWRAKSYTIEPGQEIATKKKVEFGWSCPGSFTFSLEALLQEKIVLSECTVVVSEPSIEKLFIEMPRRPDDEDHAHGVTSPLELGPVFIVSHINAEEASGTFGFIQSTHVFLERSCSDGSEQIFQTPETLTTTQTIGIEKRVIKEAQHLNRFEKKTLTTEYVTDFHKMFEKPECMEIKMKNNFKTFVAFQPDVDCFPGITKTFIVKYTQDYLEWEWAANAIRDGASWKLQNPSWHSGTKSENKRWRPADWTKTINDKIAEKWTAKMSATT